MASKTLIIATMVGAMSIMVSTTGSAREFIYGSWVSPKHGVNKAGLVPMFKAVEEETHGAVKWKLLAGGQVVSARSTLAGIRDRIVDAGLVIQVFTRKDLKINNVIFDLQAFGDDPVAVAGAATEATMLNCPGCMKEYKKSNTVFLGALGITPFYLACKEKLTTVADFKGKKIRAVGAGKRWVHGLGAVPVAMPPTEGVTAMQRGAIDCLLAPIAWLRSFGFIDVVKHFVEFNTGFPRSMCIFCMNRSSWDSLTDGEKRIMWKHMPGVSARATVIGYIEEDKAVKKLGLARGIQFHKAGDDFKKRKAAHMESELKAIPKSMKKLGVRNPEALIKKFLEIYPKWQKISAEANNDVHKYEAALQSQIYSKIDPTKW